jgi:hypothetical protein
MTKLYTLLHTFISLCSDIVISYKKETIIVMILHGLVMLGTLFSFAGIFVLVKSYARSEPISFLWISHTLNTRTVVIMTVIIAASGILTAWTNYYCQTYIANITVDFQRKMILESLGYMISDKAGQWTSYFKEHPKKALSFLINSVIRRRSILFRELLQSIMPLIVFIVSVIIMIQIDIYLFLLILPFGVLQAYPFARISLNTSRIQSEFESASIAARDELNHTFENLFNHEAGPTTKEEVLQDFVNNDILFKPKLLFLKRFLQNDKMQALNTSFFFVIVLILIIYQFLLRSHDSWETLLIFLIALRFCLGSFRSVAGTVVHFSRFYSALVEYDKLRAFLRDLSGRLSLCRTETKLETITLFDSSEYRRPIQIFERGNTIGIISPSTGADPITLKQTVVQLMSFCANTACLGDSVWYLTKADDIDLLLDPEEEISKGREDKIFIVIPSRLLEKAMLNKILERVGTSKLFCIIIFTHKYLENNYLKNGIYHIPILMIKDGILVEWKPD